MRHLPSLPGVYPVIQRSMAQSLSEVYQQNDSENVMELEATKSPQECLSCRLVGSGGLLLMSGWVLYSLNRSHAVYAKSLCIFGNCQVFQFWNIQ